MKAWIKLRVQNQLARVMDENHKNVVKKYFSCQLNEFYMIKSHYFYECREYKNVEGTW